MSMNLVRTGSAAVVGAASGVLDSPKVKPLTFGATVISWGLVAEAVALVGGAVMQFAMPFTMPNVADGLVDGSAALLVARGAKKAMSSVGTTPAASYAPMVGSRVSPALGGGNPAGAYARGALSNLGKRTLS